jgi:uncharacterized membrane protein YbhN (UPF0104 family)
MLVAAMLLGSLALWLGVPAAWLWVGSKVQGETGSVGDAILVMMLGIAVSIAILVQSLSWLNRRHVEVRAARGLDVGDATALERVLVASGALVLVGFAVWFFGFSGSEPFPLNISY